MSVSVGPPGEPAECRPDGGRQLGEQRPVEHPDQFVIHRPASARSTSRAAAAASSVVPYPARSMRRIDSSGSHASRHVSRNVPDEPRPSSAVPHGTPSASSRCSRIERRRPFGVRRSTLDRRRVPRCGRSRADFCSRATSRASGTWGADDGTVPIASPTTSSRRTSADVAHHRIGGVEHLGQPGRGRPRSAASAWPVASRRSDRRAMPRSRRAATAGDLDEEARHAVAPGCSNTWRYQPGLDTPGCIPTRCQPAMGPRHPRRGDLQLREPAETTRPRRRRRRLPLPASATVPSARSAQMSSAGTCHAPQTTTIGPSDSFAGGTDRSSHVGLALEFAAGRDEAGADRGHRRRRRLERGRAVAAVFDHVLPPAFGVGITGGRGQITRADRAGVARPTSSSSARSGAAKVTASGRSIARTSTSCSFAHSIACHSGLNTANGANAARAGSATTYPSSATGGTSPAAPTHRSAGSRSAGSSTRTIAGCDGVERPHHRRGPSPGRGGGRPAGGRSGGGAARRHVAALTRRGRGRRRRSHPSRHGRAPPSRGTPAMRPHRAPGR